MQDFQQRPTTAIMVRRAVAPWLLLALLAGGCAMVRHFQAGQASFERGLVLFDQGRFDAAIAQFREAIAENPDHGQAYLYLGRSYVSVRRWRDAIQPLRTAYRLSPNQTKEEVFNILLDALLAASTVGSPLDRPRSSDRLPEPP
jgi:cytochrome c-type biogenesis protein CcmH/NrfG